MEKEQEQKNKPVKYYGKKAYRVHPLLARVKSPDNKVPECKYEDIEESQVIKASLQQK